MDSTSTPALLDDILTTTAPLLATNSTSASTIASLEAPLLPGSTNAALLDAVTTISPNGTSLSENNASPIASIFVSVVLLIVILGTIIGNILVCIAVVKVRKLRRPCNYLLVSLAVSDLCVALLVMPTALIYEVVEDWPFGTFFCDMWVSFDVLSCAASILNLCAISVDRYWAITKPLEYGVKRTPRRMLLCVALVWLGAACISLPPLLILGNEHETETGEPQCAVCQNFGYQIYATLGSFYIPLSVMLFVYYRIFRAARRIVLDEKRAQTHLEKALNGGTQEKPKEAVGATALIGSPHQKKLRFQLAKERKASTTLGIIMSAFTVCWLPFFILALVRPFLDDNHPVPKTLSSLFLWLGYANSLFNPIIYATLNRDFRKPFQEILYFRCSSLNVMMREEYYHSQYGEPASQRVVLGGEGQNARESFL
ncbi:5-hydroxytryptamine receptor 1 [Phlebotomus papatasi]|uniref:5-hydroxytryptamine receptor 1 n=1 Tax=Phlebotomus papatasi TaxID=29031 RepID=UPI0024840B50|nr:5-hydroxytryptamine receptor 1 [Phlebotomus papatasi]